MGRDDLLRQADNADRHADQAIDDNLKAVLRSAAAGYRADAERKVEVVTGGENVRIV